MVLKDEKNIKLRFLPREPGVFTKEQVQAIYEVVYDQGIGSMEHILDLPLSVSVPPHLEDRVKEKFFSVGLLVVPSGNCVKDIKICPKCDHGVRSYRKLGRTLNEELMGKETPTSVRISVSGCSCRCGMTMLQDIGLVAGLEGYSMYIGGTPYGKPIIGEKVIDYLDDEKVIPAIKAVLSIYESQKGNKKYLYQVVKAIGIESFKRAIEEVK